MVRPLTRRWFDRAALAALLVAAPVTLAGCHDAQRLRQELDGPPVRLPATPGHTHTPPVPALLDTVQPYQPQNAYPATALATWQLASAHITGQYDLTYRVPLNWSVPSGGARGQNTAGTIQSRATATDLDDSHISLATYAAQLADGAPIFQYTTDSGNVVYVTRRVVALAPSDPDAVREVFHTAVTSVDGRIAKLDVRYDIHDDWRFDELADAITGTVQIHADA
jgi:hypothetical protein